MTQTPETPLACNLGAFDAAERERHQALVHDLLAARQEVWELPDGYALRFTSERERLLALAEFVSLERLCCPFLTFGLDVEGASGPLWLRLTGRTGVKELLKLELGL